MEWVLLVLGLLFAASILVMVVNTNQKSEREDHEKRLLEELELDEIFVFRHETVPAPFMLRREATVMLEPNYFIGIKWSSDELFFGGASDPKSVGFADIVGAEIIKDDQSITQTNRTSQLAGAAIGAVAFGGVGAILGGLSGSSRSRQNVKSISIRIELEHNEVLGFTCTFFRAISGKGESPGSPEVVKQAEEANRWYSLVQRAMRVSSNPQSRSA